MMVSAQQSTQLSSQAEGEPLHHRHTAVEWLLWAAEATLFTGEQLTSGQFTGGGRALPPASPRYWFPHVDLRHPRWLDPLRIVLQILWLLFFRQPGESPPPRAATRVFRQWLGRVRRWAGDGFRRGWSRFKQLLSILPAGRAGESFDALSSRVWLSHSWRDTVAWRILPCVAAVCLVAFTMTLPMDLGPQAVMSLLFWVIALWLRDVQQRGALLIMVVLSLLVSTRYLVWRLTSTVNWDVPLDTFFSLTLLSAEVYAWTILVLGYIQTVWPLQRHVAALPSESRQWPSVDVFIPTYNEPLSVVQPTVQAALAMDWPSDKLNVILLDDGRRPEFADFAAQAGARYLTRTDNSHAKAGNLNAALSKTHGEYIAIFDCDHIPTRAFLQLAMGWFNQDPKLALLQTPHHFYSADPFEKNLGVFRDKPNEGDLFYGLIQDGNDLWNASFFCGSCAVLKRGPLEEVGGIAVETVTEDAHTALKLHRLGYNSAYLKLPLAAGLATESLSAHIGQRIRWARGMAQIFRVDNPLRGKGLSVSQRICYANAMLYFFNGVPRMIYMLAPLAFLLLDSYVIFAPAIMIAVYAVPHIVHSQLTNSRIQGQYRQSFWAEMYETVLAWYILRPTTVALLFPRHGKFNVTVKGGITPETYYDWGLSKPYLLLVVVCLVGFGVGLWRLVFGPANETLTVLLNLLWTSYNLIILGGAVAVAEEAKQVRASPRVQVDRPITLMTATEHMISAVLVDYSIQGAGVRVPAECNLTTGDQVRLILQDGLSETALEATVLNQRNNMLGLRFTFAGNEKEQAMLRATFARADAWVGWRQVTPDRPLDSFRDVISIGLRGYQSLARRFMPVLLPLFNRVDQVWQVVLSVLPRMPALPENEPDYPEDDDPEEKTGEETNDGWVPA